MPTPGKRYKTADSSSREKQSKILKSKLEADDSEEKKDISISSNEFNTSIVTEAAKKKAGEVKIKKTRSGMIVEQKLSYCPGPKKPILDVTIKLSTAVRGKRKTDGLVESVYMLRLELLASSLDVKIEGFQLGPWGASGLNMDQGGVLLCDPLWTGFQPTMGAVKGRLLIKDLGRNRVIDIPWKTEAVTPGAEPYPG